MSDTPTPRTDVERLLIMCNYHREITKDDKDFLALLAERIEDNNELNAITEQRDRLAEALERILPFVDPIITNVRYTEAQQLLQSLNPKTTEPS